MQYVQFKGYDLSVYTVDELNTHLSNAKLAMKTNRAYPHHPHLLRVELSSRASK